MAERLDPAPTMSLDTDRGPVPVTLCACGALLLATQIAWEHIDRCAAAATAKDGDHD